MNDERASSRSVYPDAYDTPGDGRAGAERTELANRTLGPRRGNCEAHTPEVGIDMRLSATSGSLGLHDTALQTATATAARRVAVRLRVGPVGLVRCLPRWRPVNSCRRSRMPGTYLDGGANRDQLRTGPVAVQQESPPHRTGLVACQQHHAGKRQPAIGSQSVRLSANSRRPCLDVHVKFRYVGDTREGRG